MFEDFSLSSLDVSHNNIGRLEAQIFVVRHYDTFLVRKPNVACQSHFEFYPKYNAVEKGTD